MDKAGERSSLLDNPIYQRCDEWSRGMSELQSKQARERMEAMLPQMRDDLRGVKAQLAGGYAIGWLAIIVILYTIGWAVARVHRGFAK